MTATALRPYSHVGWFMLQWLGVLVPTAFRDEVQAAARQQGKSVYQRTPNLDVHPKQREAFEIEKVDPEWLVKAFDDAYRLIGANGVESAMGGGMLAALRRDAPPRELWWLSFANDERCAGIALLWLEGEQTLARASRAAEAAKIIPDGDWEILGCEVPDAERAAFEPYAGRLLLPHEATRAFGAKSLGEWEGEYPEAVQAICEDTP